MMDERERRNIMTRAIQHFGETAQIDMAVEEMAELTKAICKVKRAQAGAEMGAAVENVVEEIADVQIMLDQLRLIFARRPTRSRRTSCAGCWPGSIAGRSRSSGAGCASRSARPQTRCYE